jgi:hypothetical protein
VGLLAQRRLGLWATGWLMPSRIRESWFACVLGMGILVACGPAPAPVHATGGNLEGARALLLTSEGPWMVHELAVARPGDLLLENAFVRFYIAGADPREASLPYAGRIIDAGLAASPERADFDGVEEIVPLVNISPLVEARVTVASDGSDGASARVVVQGRLEAVPDAFSLVGAQPEPLPAAVRVTHTYSLGPEDRALEIRTRVENGDRAAHAVKIGDLATFADDEAEAFCLPGGFDLDSDAHELELIGSAHEKQALGYALFGDGAPLTLFEQSTVRDQVGGNDTGLWGYHVADTLLEPGGVLEGVRYLTVGSDVASLLANASPASVSTSRARGGVTSGGQALGGARVSFFRDAELRDFVTQALSDAVGGFEAALPPGDYFAVATGRGDGELVAAPGVVHELAEGYLPSPVTALTVPIDGEARLNLELGAAARVRLTVRDTEGAPLPAKVTLIAEDERVAPIRIAGERVPYPAQGIRQLVWTASGDAEPSLEPGAYTVIASHGPDYELDVRRGVVLEPGASNALELVLQRVLEHDGWVMIDSHLHGVFSQHGEASGVERAVTAAAEGLDVMVATDHNYVGDYRPATVRAGLAQRLLAVPGVELTTRSGHHCVWPLTPDPMRSRGGAVYDVTSIEQSYEAYRAAGATVFTVAHGAGYFANAGYDPTTGTVSRPERFIWGFNAMELHNGKGWGGGAELVPIFASLINHGHRIAPVAASDSHTRAFEAGVGRTYVRLGDAAVDPASVAAAVTELHTVASTGPFVALDAAGAGPGDTVALDATGGVTLKIAVRAPSWQPIERVHLYENGVERQLWDASTTPAVSLRADKALWFEHELRLTPAADSWYSIEVAGNADLAPVIVDSHPWAYTAPLFVDADGDGQFTPPCSAEQPCK